MPFGSLARYTDTGFSAQFRREEPTTDLAPLFRECSAAATVDGAPHTNEQSCRPKRRCRITGFVIVSLQSKRNFDFEAFQEH